MVAGVFVAAFGEGDDGAADVESVAVSTAFAILSRTAFAAAAESVDDGFVSTQAAGLMRPMIKAPPKTGRLTASPVDGPCLY